MAPVPVAFQHMVAWLYYVLHPVTALLGKLGVTGSGLEGLDTATYALATWLLGTRENEAVRRLGIVLVAAIAAVALLEYFLAAPG